MNQPSEEFKKKILVVIALACGLLAIVLIYSYVSTEKEKYARQVEMIKRQQAQQPEQKMVSVLVAARNIPAGTKFSSEDLTSKEVPEEYVQPEAIAASFNIFGLEAKIDIASGEQILKSKIGEVVKPKILSELTPPGKRAVPVTVDNMAALTGLLQPGDYVDVLAIIAPPESSPLYSLAQEVDAVGSKGSQKTTKIVSVPLFQHVPVLTVGSPEKKETKSSRPSSSASDNVVTLSLSPQEAALIAFVQEQGKIKLLMRSNEDFDEASLKTVNWDTLFDYLYPGAKEGVKKPVTVEVYRGLQKENVPLLEGKNK